MQFNLLLSDRPKVNNDHQRTLDFGMGILPFTVVFLFPWAGGHFPPPKKIPGKTIFQAKIM